mmetsp:Transcript_401/g.1562  ORF Transcript_401/g.1562 Transcript_401/m.1562 type:complete len:474 (+) Transcript_401:1-1422(+)
MASTQSRARVSPVSCARDGLGDGVDSIAFRMAKERAVLAEKRAKMAQVRAVDLEQLVKDKEAHIQLLQDELVNYAKVSTSESASAYASARAATRDDGHRGITATASNCARDSTIRQLAERLRRAKLNSERRAQTLQERLAKAEARAAKAETAAASKKSRCSSSAPVGKLAETALRLKKEQEKANGLSEKLDALSEFVARTHGACVGMVHDDGDLYEGFLKQEQPEVFGTCVYKCGDRYVGEWRAGKPHGFGECVFFANGCVYRGGWRHGGYHGKGVYTYANGDTFDGVWVDDERHGVGVFKNGSGLREEVYENGTLKKMAARGGGESGENENSSSRFGNTGRGEPSGRRNTTHDDATVMREIQNEIRGRYETSWRQFECNFLAAESEKQIDWHDVPWPPKNLPLVLVDELSSGRDSTLTLTLSRKRRCAVETKRWHPDKWVGKTLAPHAREKIMAEVTNVFRRVDAEKQKAGL